MDTDSPEPTPATPAPKPRPLLLPQPSDAELGIPSRRAQVLTIVAIIIAALVPAAAAFGFDLCKLGLAVGVHFDACKAPPAALPADAPEAE